MATTHLKLVTAGLVGAAVGLLSIWAAAEPSDPPSVTDEVPILSSGKVGKDCAFKGTKLWGKVKVVDAFADFEVKVVRAFADVHVKKVDAFPDKCGRWQFVDSFPDFTVKFVDSFPDFEIKYVDAFPGVP